MGLKNLDIFKNRTARSISFKGIQGAQRVVDRQYGGECWIEAIENLYQLYLPTIYLAQYLDNLDCPVSPVLKKHIAKNLIKPQVEEAIKEENSESVEDKIRTALVDDFLDNKGIKYGYCLDFKILQKIESGEITDKLVGRITAQDTFSDVPEFYKIDPDVREVIKEKGGKSRSYLHKLYYPRFIVDDNVGAYASLPTGFDQPRTDEEKSSMCDGIAFYRIIRNVLGIKVEFQKFNETEIRKALDEDRPVLFRMNVIGMPGIYEGKKGGHVVLIVDYEKNGDDIEYVIIDSNFEEEKHKDPYRVSSKVLCDAAKKHRSTGTKYQLLIPEKGTDWNRVMSV